jgi:hypothetical protein
MNEETQAQLHNPCVKIANTIKPRNCVLLDDDLEFSNVRPAGLLKYQTTFPAKPLNFKFVNGLKWYKFPE